jgi:hypothetical protein
VDNLVEVGVGGTVIATPDASHADSAKDAPGRGMAFEVVQQPQQGDVSL